VQGMQTLDSTNQVLHPCRNSYLSIRIAFKICDAD